MIDNYPDNMNWADFDESTDPKLECGHYSSDGCDCWCENYVCDGKQHIIGDCDPDNCLDYRCAECKDVAVDYETDLCVECQEEEDEVTA